MCVLTIKDFSACGTSCVQSCVLTTTDSSVSGTSCVQSCVRTTTDSSATGKSCVQSCVRTSKASSASGKSCVQSFTVSVTTCLCDHLDSCTILSLPRSPCLKLWGHALDNHSLRHSYFVCSEFKLKTSELFSDFPVPSTSQGPSEGARSNSGPKKRTFQHSSYPRVLFLSPRNFIILYSDVFLVRRPWVNKLLSTTAELPCKR